MLIFFTMMLLSLSHREFDVDVVNNNVELIMFFMTPSFG